MPTLYLDSFTSYRKSMLNMISEVWIYQCLIAIEVEYNLIKSRHINLLTSFYPINIIPVYLNYFIYSTSVPLLYFLNAFAIVSDSFLGKNILSFCFPCINCKNSRIS